ncbi:TIGR00730 family Rossman fold protein [Candidatus Uhrbacteria bacterium CG10_big_fil_rev_8_21_14_0_10_48_11]|uniref:Cytokinin riboside 5'-monophosphate phosphoribohydrolase n=1 Tax=Candidatus Uhrbacteria bacterium CG10_big_fil_rev_8_21_14_0_10_48_11 TaxID=1975037 RepID=A0A2M8LFJ7_9BACT|nr:MAG: TIGR00730 family Rossman fold protein [Candidatus Uhrbacteria bacterium CG10_big_fil_rev_8_21_14_0_10_48_11]
MSPNHTFASPAQHSLNNADRLKRINEEFKAGYALVETITNGVTFFGSSRMKDGEDHYNNARQLANELAKRGSTIITGGGPGIMEAANCGAREAGGRSVAFNIELKKEQGNQYITDAVSFYYFFIRKVMLASSAKAYVFYPGGFGTLDEFFEISTLIETNKLHEDVPVVLMGTDYWEPLMRWLRHTVVEKHHAFEPEDFSMWKITDSVEEALDVIERCNGRMGVCKY